MADNLTSLSKPELVGLVKDLRNANQVLRGRVLLLEKHASNSTGFEAEQFVAKLLNVDLTKRNAGHDLATQNGRKIEIKGSKSNVMMIGAYQYRRWTWHNFLGIGKKPKIYDNLILVAQADPDCRSEYRDKTSDYVVFDVPFDWGKALSQERAKYNGRFSFPLMAKPSSAKSRRGLELWGFEVTRKELVSKYTLR